LVDRDSGHAFPPTAFGPLDNPAQAMVDCLVRVATEARELPESIEFSDRELLRAVTPALAVLGVRAEYRVELTAFDQMAEALRDHLLGNPPKR